MKKPDYGIIAHIYYAFFIVLLIIIFLCISAVSYLLRNNTGSGDSFNNWSSGPIPFTADFYKKIKFKDGRPEVTPEGIADLQKYKLSFQLLDKNGDAFINYNSPSGTLMHYSPIEMVQLYKNGGDLKNYTMFVGSAYNNGEKWTYIIGFPVKILKLTVYLNYDKAYRFKFVVLGMLFMVMLLIAVFGIKVSRDLSNVIKGIGSLASDTYDPIKEKGIYSGVYKSLNALDKRLKAGEVQKKKDETLREEWIANISHDLKTPLSPIKGYAEILADSEYKVNGGDIRKYGQIILRNSENIENIVENLNFTYQLKNNMIPVNRQPGNIVRLLKEVVINILNSPEYEYRNIIFCCSEDRINLNFDDTLLRRAFNNLIYNAVVHNAADTMIKISIKEEDKLYITIEDNGKGIEEEELKRLFERYYRGTTSKVKIQGSGLGMAIAKQIIEAHEGSINVISKINSGTTINIGLSKHT